MPGPRLLCRYVLILVLFLLGDSIWLGVVTDDFYRDRIGHLMGPVFWPAALVFYLVYGAGILYFAVQPALAGGAPSVSGAGVRGALFGAVAYATYDLTNLATLEGWPLDMVVIDICWGAVLTGAVAAASSGVARRLRI